LLDALPARSCFDKLSTNGVWSFWPTLGKHERGLGFQFGILFEAARIGARCASRGAELL
jgi:hypothetical protein